MRPQDRASRATVSRYFRAIASRAWWRPPLTTVFPPAITRSIRARPAENIIDVQHHVAAARRRGRDDPDSAPRCPRGAPLRWHRCRRPAPAPRLSAHWCKASRPVDFRLRPVVIRLRPRCFRRCEYSSWRSSAGASIWILESVPMPKRPLPSRNNSPLKMPSPRLPSVSGHKPATAPECASRCVSSSVMWVA